MASTINASTSPAAIVQTADGTGILSLQTGNTTAVTIDSSQNVGIGTTTSAGYKLFVDGNIYLGGTSSNVYVAPSTTTNNALTRYINTGGTAYVGLDNSAGGLGTAYAFNIFYTGAYPIVFATNGTERMRMTSAGSLCIGTTTPNSQFLSSAARLTVGQWGLGPTVDYGNFYLQNSSGVGVQLTSGSTSWSALSDERIKTDLKPIENAVEKVSTLRAVTGRYIKDEDTVSRAFLIAQDVQAVLPEAVTAGEDEDKTLQLKYTEVIPLLVAAIKEQQTIINDLKARVETLESK